jgi:hypothetical protein
LRGERGKALQPSLACLLTCCGVVALDELVQRVVVDPVLRIAIVLTEHRLDVRSRGSRSTSSCSRRRGPGTGTLTQPGELILGRYEDGELRIIGRTSPINRTAARSLTPLLRTAAADHPWPSVIRVSAYDRFGPKRETQLTLIEPFTVQISADTAIVGGAICHAARFERARPEVDPGDIA